MKRFLTTFLLLTFMSAPAWAEYKANYWASWASVTQTAVTWTFPFKTREVNVHNGSSVPVCISFNGATILNNVCTSPTSTAQAQYGDNKVFQIGANQILLLQDFVTSSVTLQSSATAASPVSVVVTY